MNTLRQTLVSDRIDALSVTLNIPPDEAFERLAHSLCTGVGIYDFDEGDLVDGAQDKQIDLISLQEEENEATIYFISSKSEKGFSSNAIVLTRNGLDWIFRKPKTEVETLSNIAFKEKIAEVRSTLQRVGYSNVNIKVFFVTKGLSSQISDEFRQEVKAIKSDFDNGSFKSFSFDALGADEIVNYLNRQEKKERSIDAEIAIKYDTNAPSLIRYVSKGRRGIICTANASEIARLVNEDNSGALFESNVRRFLGQSGSVNTEISATAVDEEESSLFWFLNNGITILCDNMDAVTDPDDPKIKVKNLQIVNGCQTASSLAHAASTGLLQPDTHVLVKIFETQNESFGSKIVLTTNNQNRISSRDLKANDPIQIDIRSALEPYGYLYEHKLNQYLGIQIPQGKKVVSNENIAQSYLAVILKMPGDARRRKYKIWSEYYNRIFKVAKLAEHVLAHEVVALSSEWARANKKAPGISSQERRLLAGGGLHLACAAYQAWRKENSTQDADGLIDLLRKSPSTFNDYLSKALASLILIVDSNPVFRDDLDLALKSQTFDDAINLQSTPRKGTQLPLGFAL
jgi:AIPR protein